MALTIPFRKRLPFEVRKNLTPPTSACLGVGLLESDGPAYGQKVVQCSGDVAILPLVRSSLAPSLTTENWMPLIVMLYIPFTA